MTKAFEYFVVFASMRTGSNFLEANLNALEDVSCFGEAFNPHFIGYPNSTEISGVSQTQRDENPELLLEKIRKQHVGIAGFRYLNGHDPRIFRTLVHDPVCAKIVLTRNPLDSYVSWKIAQQTDQWKLTDVKRRKDATVKFNAEEFATYVDDLHQFQLTLLSELQKAGQTAFFMAYEDLQDVQVINGLASYLGAEGRLEALDRSLKKQNPKSLFETVENLDEMEAALSKMDCFALSQMPNFEPRRGPVVPRYIRAAKAPLVYLPIGGGPDQAVKHMMAQLDEITADQLPQKMSQKELRIWKRAQPEHRSFTVLRHPVARAHHAFCNHILMPGPERFDALRNTLIRRYDMLLPDDPHNSAYEVQAHRRAFFAFLLFLKGNLAGQTAVRVDAAWCTQAQAIAGFGEFALPDRIIREKDLEVEFASLIAPMGYQAPVIPDVPECGPFLLAEVYDATVEQRVADVYQRDYMMFGFDSWR